MSKLLRSLLVLGLATLGLVAAMPSASAAVATGGYDVSYPQCGSRLPAGQAFGIVGVNGGLATTANNCLGTQLRWAWQSVGGTAQAKAQTYLNTANPGQIRDQVTTWPGSGSNRYGTCTGGNDQACSYEYGQQRAQNSVQKIFAPAATNAGLPSTPGSYTWWLDVETSNTWQSGSSAALANNRATLEGMADYLKAAGAPRIGIYSTGTQWQQIAGTVPATSTLAGLDSWLAGATSQNGAKNNCYRPALVPGGAVTVTQYVSGGIDHDVSCR
jgi:hypothetical protein